MYKILIFDIMLHHCVGGDVMNKKILRLFQPGMQLYFIFLILFSVATFFYGTQSRLLAVIEISIIILLYFFQEYPAEREVINF